MCSAGAHSQVSNGRIILDLKKIIISEKNDMVAGDRWALSETVPLQRRVPNPAQSPSVHRRLHFCFEGTDLGLPCCHREARGPWELVLGSLREEQWVCVWGGNEVAGTVPGEPCRGDHQWVRGQCQRGRNSQPTSGTVTWHSAFGHSGPVLR